MKIFKHMIKIRNTQIKTTMKILNNFNKREFVI